MSSAAVVFSTLRVKRRVFVHAGEKLDAVVKHLCKLEISHVYSYIVRNHMLVVYVVYNIRMHDTCQFILVINHMLVMYMVNTSHGHKS